MDSTLVTLAEQSGFTQTGRLDEVDRLCAAMAAAWPDGAEGGVAGGGLVFFCAGRSTAAVSAVAPQTRHSQFAGISASAANGTLNRWPFGQSKATS